MKMHPTVNSDESIATANRFAHVVRYADHPSQRAKEQISSSKNAQTEFETHLSQNVARSSTYGPSVIITVEYQSLNVIAMPSDRHGTYPERAVNNIAERSLPRNSEKIEQKHKGIGTRDFDSPPRQRSTPCTLMRLLCTKLCRKKKKYSERIMEKPTRWLHEWSRECREPDETDVSTALYRHRSVPKKSTRSHKHDKTMDIVTDKDIFDHAEEERRDRRRKETKERDKWRRRERRKHEEKMSYAADMRSMWRDDEDLVVEDHVSGKPPTVTDLAKSCCYLCVQNSLAIAAATSKPEQSDKWVQVSDHKFRTATPPALDKSCSPTLLVRTVQSSVKVRTRETSTHCPGISAMPARGEAEPKAKKRKKFNVFPGLTRTKCPMGPHAACKTDKSTVRRDGNTEKREPRNEKCCRNKHA